MGAAALEPALASSLSQKAADQIQPSAFRHHTLNPGVASRASHLNLPGHCQAAVTSAVQK